MTMRLESKTFDDGGIIPKKHGYKHGNISPHLKISGIPENTAYLALIMDDPDALDPAGKVWVHWVVWNIRPEDSEFEENSTAPDSVEGKTDFDEIGYGGPAPPDKEHTYVFRLYALDKKLDLAPGSTQKQVESAIKNHVIEETVLYGRYAP